MQEIYEKLGLFYLGKDIDKNSMESTEALTLLKNKNLTTHAAIIGMTGSGKTGLGVGIIEEAAIDNIPDNMLMKAIMTEKWISLTYRSESFVDWRRNKFGGVGAR